MFRRRKLVFTCLLFLVCILVVVHKWKITTSSNIFETSSSVMNNLRSVEKRFAKSLDLSTSKLKSYLPSARSLGLHSQKFLKNVKKAGGPSKRKRSKKHEDIDKIYQDTKECVRLSQRHLALSINNEYESEFAPDFRPSRTKTSPLLEPECDLNLDLVIILTTRPGSFVERSAIRYSWGRPESAINKLLVNRKSFKFKTIFTMGRDRNHIIESIVATENSRYKDILRLDYPDSYENLAKKTLLTLKWVSEVCVPKFVLKTDDDCYVNLFNLLPWLQRLSPHVDYVGKKNDYMPVIRDPTHRNYVSFELISDEYYKAYCSGGGYILRGTVLKNLTRKAKEIPEIINEDAYMGMITNALDITPYDDERFLPFIFGDVSINKRHMCDWTDKFLMHGVSPNRQLLMHWQKLAMIEYTALCD